MKELHELARDMVAALDSASPAALITARHCAGACDRHSPDQVTERHQSISRLTLAFAGRPPLAHQSRI